MNEVNVLHRQFTLDFCTGVQVCQGVMYETIGMSVLEFQRTEVWKRR